MNEIKRIGEIKGCQEISLSVWSFNEKAFKFYIKNGFEIQTFRMEFKM
jgi:ribosomal protein S18 acetylase RimI-like enzyme